MYCCMAVPVKEGKEVRHFHIASHNKRSLLCMSACIVLGVVMVSFRSVTMQGTLSYFQETSAYQ